MSSRFLKPRARARIGAGVWILLVAGCAQTEIRSQGETMQRNLPSPGRVLVYDLAVNAGEVTANQSIVAREMAAQSSESSWQQATEIGHQAADAFATDLVAELLKTGLNAQRATRDSTIYQNDFLVMGHFIDVNEGNRLRRLVIGFGAGASDVNAQIFVYQEAGDRKREVLEFATHADSGDMPGAAVTMGAGAAAQGGARAGSPRSRHRTQRAFSSGGRTGERRPLAPGRQGGEFRCERSLALRLWPPSRVAA
jgi:hypothetical protein